MLKTFLEGNIEYLHRDIWTIGGHHTSLSHTSTDFHLAVPTVNENY